MLLDIFDPYDDACKQCIDYAQSILDSDAFLAGLGKYSSKTAIPQTTNTITDFERAEYLMNSREMWDDPTQDESGDQYFSGVLEGAMSYPDHRSISREEYDLRKKIFGDNSGSLDEYLTSVVEEAYKKNDVAELLSKKFTNANAGGIERHLKVHYPSIVYMCISNWIRTGYFGGKHHERDVLPLCSDLIDALAKGGVPTGWIGPPPENGGKGKDCLQIIHFGPKE